MEAANYGGELSSRLRLVSGALTIRQRNPAHMDLQFREELSVKTISRGPSACGWNRSHGLKDYRKRAWTSSLAVRCASKSVGRQPDDREPLMSALKASGGMVASRLCPYAC